MSNILSGIIENELMALRMKRLKKLHEVLSILEGERPDLLERYKYPERWKKSWTARQDVKRKLLEIEPSLQFLDSDEAYVHTDGQYIVFCVPVLREHIDHWVFHAWVYKKYLVSIEYITPECSLDIKIPINEGEI